MNDDQLNAYPEPNAITTPRNQLEKVDNKTRGLVILSIPHICFRGVDCNILFSVRIIIVCADVERLQINQSAMAL